MELENATEGNQPRAYTHTATPGTNVHYIHRSQNSLSRSTDSLCVLQAIKNTAQVGQETSLCAPFSLRFPAWDSNTTFHWSWLSLSLRTFQLIVPSCLKNCLDSLFFCSRIFSRIFCGLPYGTFATLLVQSKSVQITVSNNPEYSSTHCI